MIADAPGSQRERRADGRMVLAIEDLHVEIRRGSTVTRPVRGVSLTVGAGQTVGVVGETGSGKTLTGLAVLRLLPAGASATGEVRLDGEDVLRLPARRLRALRGAQVAMIFQNPGTAFNPVVPIGAQFAQVIRSHRQVTRAAARDISARLLADVELADVERVLHAYPHQLSGGMLQRAMVALALACEPRLLIADEATSALDVTVARAVRRLLLRLQQQRGFGLLFITHNIGEAYDMCDHVHVLNTGVVVEDGPVTEVFANPRHAYTKRLLAAVPTLGTGSA